MRTVSKIKAELILLYDNCLSDWVKNLRNTLVMASELVLQLFSIFQIAHQRLYGCYIISNSIYKILSDTYG